MDIYILQFVSTLLISRFFYLLSNRISTDLRNLFLMKNNTVSFDNSLLSNLFQYSTLLILQFKVCMIILVYFTYLRQWTCFRNFFINLYKSLAHKYLVIIINFVQVYDILYSNFFLIMINNWIQHVFLWVIIN